MHFLDWKLLYLIMISLRFVSQGSIDNMSALVEILTAENRWWAMTWTNVDQVLWCHMTSPSFNELTLTLWSMGKIMPFKDIILTHSLWLTHCGLVTQCRYIDLNQHWLRLWPVAWQNQAITWTNVDLPSVIQPWAISQEICQPSITRISLKW